MMGKTSVICWLLSVTTGLAAGGGWQALPPAPVGIGNFAGGAFRDDLIVAGGITWRKETKVWLDNIWRFDTRKNSWSETGKLPHPIAYAAFGQAKEGMFFAGGGDGKRVLPESRWLDRTLQWRKLGAVPQPLVYSGCCIAAARLYVVAGATDAADLGTATNLFYAVDLKTGRVASLGEFPGGKVVLPAAAALGGRIYVFAGATFGSTGNPAVNLDSAWVYSMAEAKWSGLRPLPFPVRGLASCVLDQRHILLAGGYRENFTDEAFVYDTRTGNYSRTIPLPYRAMTCLIKCGSDVYCVGGEDRMKHRSDLLFKITGRELLEAARRP